MKLRMASKFFFFLLVLAPPSSLTNKRNKVVVYWNGKDWKKRIKSSILSV